MTTKYPLSSIHTIGSRKVFFDANVLIYIFWASGAYHLEPSYSSAFGKLLRQGNELLVDFTVISEVVNRTHRLEYDKYLIANNITKGTYSYKKYRNNTEGQSALSDIYLVIETTILQKFTVIGKAFNKQEIQSFLTVDSLDFGDKGILMTCKENACILLTNDIDYKFADIDVLTANPAFFK